MVDYTSDELHQWNIALPEYKVNKIILKSNDKSAQLNGLFLDNAKSQDLIFVIQGNGMKVSQGGMKMMKQLAHLYPNDFKIRVRQSSNFENCH